MESRQAQRGGFLNVSGNPFVSSGVQCGMNPCTHCHSRAFYGCVCCIQQGEGWRGLGGFEPVVEVLLFRDEGGSMASAPGRALLQPLRQGGGFTYQRQVGNRREVASLNTRFDILWNAHARPEKEYRSTGLGDVFAYPQPGFEESPVAILGSVELGSPEDIAIQDDDLGNVA